MTARAFREAGACVRQNVFLRVSPGLEANRSPGSMSSLFVAALSWLWTSPSAAWSVAPAKPTHMQQITMERSCSRTRRRHFPNSLPPDDANSSCSPWRRVAGGARRPCSADPADAGTLQSARRTSVHAVLCGPHVGKTMDIAYAVSFASSLVEPPRHTSWCRTGGEMRSVVGPGLGPSVFMSSKKKKREERSENEE